MSEAKATSPLRYPELRRIVAGYTVNRLGTWFGFIALAVVVFDHTHSAIAVASLLIASQVLPALIVPALVARVETSTRRGELTRLYLFEAATTGALIALVLWHFSLPAILAAGGARRHRGAGRERAAARGRGAQRARVGAHQPGARRSGRVHRRAVGGRPSAGPMRP